MTNTNQTEKEVVTIHSIKAKAAQERASRKRHIQTQGTYISHGWEENNKPDMTVPDQTMTLKQILERHTRGQEIPVLQPFYSHTEDWDNYLPYLTCISLASTSSSTIEYLIFIPD